jgi:hypothetical protein
MAEILRWQKYWNGGSTEMRIYGDGGILRWREYWDAGYVEMAEILRWRKCWNGGSTEMRIYWDGGNTEMAGILKWLTCMMSWQNVKRTRVNKWVGHIIVSRWEGSWAVAEERESCRRDVHTYTHHPWCYGELCVCGDEWITVISADKCLETCWVSVGIQWSRREADYSPLTNAKRWSYTSAPNTCLYSVPNGNLYLRLFSNYAILNHVFVFQLCRLYSQYRYCSIDKFTWLATIL